MQWSKLKKRVESQFAPSVSGRVELRVAHYRKSHDWLGRAWITIDREEICNFCSWKHGFERGKLATSIREVSGATDRRYTPDWDAYYEAGDQADIILEREGIVPQDYFEEALESYLDFTVEEALNSRNFIHRGLAVLDRRFGKRRLLKYEPRLGENQIVIRLLNFRLTAERLARPELPRP